MRAVANNRRLTGRLPTPDEAIARLRPWMSASRPAETVGLETACGRVLTRDVVSDYPMPQQPRAKADGYAVRCDDLGHELSVRVEQTANGRVRKAIRHGEAVRVRAGAVLPPGSDAVVALDYARESGGCLTLTRRPDAGENVTRIGSNFASGDVIVRGGTRLQIPDIAQLAMLGIAQAEVFQRPAVGVISIGDDVVLPGSDRAPWQNYDVNRYTVGAALNRWGAAAVPFPAVNDDVASITATLELALKHCAAVVLSGGSRCDHRTAIADMIGALGSPGVLVHEVKMKPGRPTLLAVIDGKPIIVLPGKPADALMALFALGAPIVNELCGTGRPEMQSGWYTLAEPLHGNRGWDCYVPVRLTANSCFPLSIGPRFQSPVVNADGFVRVPPASSVLAAGTAVFVAKVG